MTLESIGARGPVVIAVVLVTSLLAGCIGDEEAKPRPEPKAVLSGPAEAWVGELLEFNASGSRDDKTEFDALDFRWEMGDNTTYKGKPFVSRWIVAPNHTYERAGTYTVNLTVTDAWGNAGLANATVVVRYQLNLTVNHQGTWLSEDALNNTTYYNLTVSNVWTGLFDVPRVQPRMLNETGGQLAPRATTGDAVPANLTAGEAFTFQVHFRPPDTFEPVRLRLCEELCLDLAEGS